MSNPLEEQLGLVPSGMECPFKVLDINAFFESACDQILNIPDLNDPFYEDLYDLLSQGRWSIYYTDEIREKILSKFDLDYINKVTQSPDKVKVAGAIKSGLIRIPGLKTFSNYI